MGNVVSTYKTHAYFPLCAEFPSANSAVCAAFPRFPRDAPVSDPRLYGAVSGFRGNSESGRSL